MLDAAAIKDRAAVGLARGALLESSRREACVRNLVFLYHAMVASERLLERAAELDISVAGSFFREHLEEERDHAAWLREDLQGEILGEGDSLVASMVGAQYYFIEHVDPAALLGYLLVMECFPVPLDRIGEVEALHGKTLFRTLRHHAVHDINHGERVLSVIDALQPERRGIILQSAAHTAACMALASHSFNPR